MHTSQDIYIPQLRYSSIPLGVITTFVLFTLMAQLISHNMEEPKFLESSPIVYPIYEEEVIDTQLREKIVEKPKVESPPELPPRSIDDDFESEISHSNFEPVSIKSEDIGMKISGLPIPQYQVAARYPNNAISRNIEGFVDVKFDITKIGTTENISIVRGVPEGIFDRSVINAVKRWRYRPKMEEGEAVAYPGMVQRVSFELEN